jgi:hypothetical protein
LTNPHEALVIGNGDLAASAQVFSHGLLLTLGKNDVWDSRISARTEEAVLKHDELVRSGGELGSVRRERHLQSTDYIQKSARGPSPKRVALIRLTHPGLSDTALHSEVDVARGVLTVQYGFRHGQLRCEAFVHRRKNTLMLRLSARGSTPWVNISLEKPPDFAASDMPLPNFRRGAGESQRVLSQTIPGGCGVEEFAWYVASSFPPGGPGSKVWGVVDWPYAVREDIQVEDGGNAVFTVGVATDRESTADPLQEAVDLAGPADPDRFADEMRSHAGGWDEFWAASAVELEDKELEALWYRSLYGFACHLKPGVQGPGLNANIPVYDYSAWNGFYTWNHNVQKWYFPALPVNHPEWYEIFADLIEQHIPVFEYLAELIFGLDGTYCDLMTAPFAPPERAKTHSAFGRALAHTGWLAMMLFQHYEFTGDAEWLEERAYPYIRRAATFYAGYMEKYRGADGDIYPSVRLEDSGWYDGFVGNRNVVTDLVMFRKAFEVAIRSSEILGRDERERARWKASLARVPPIEYGWRDGSGWYALCKDWEKVWPDFDQYLQHLRYSRWGCSGWLVFPGEHVDGDEPDGLAAVVRDVLREVDLTDLPDSTRQLGTFHGESVVTPFIRLGMTDHFEQIRTLLLDHTFASGQFSPYAAGEGVYVRSPHCFSWRIVENQYFPILAITEMLLQSQGGVIRLFPFWPREMSAAFGGLRARGGFLVSARWQPDHGATANVSSLCGNPCRVRCEHPGSAIVREGDTEVDCTVEGRDLVFETERDRTYELVLP